MIVSFFPAGGPSTANGFSNWREMGIWYWNLETGRFDASPEMKQKVTELTASITDPLTKMRALAKFAQHDIRYVAIELGIGGWQPHPAADIFNHRYGDCKDKATLMRSMLHEIGIESYQVAINTHAAPWAPTPGPPGIQPPDSCGAVARWRYQPGVVGHRCTSETCRLLFFDPTNELTPFGNIFRALQANWGLLIAPAGGEMVQLPKEPAAMNSIQRTAKLTLNSTGMLTGEVKEVRIGDRAARQRYALRKITNDEDRIKPLEALLADSLSIFHITKASIVNFSQTDLPFGFNFSFNAENYAKNAGDLILLRPRVLGTKTQRPDGDERPPAGFRLSSMGRFWIPIPLKSPCPMGTRSTTCPRQSTLTLVLPAIIRNLRSQETSSVTPAPSK